MEQMEIFHPHRAFRAVQIDQFSDETGLSVVRAFEAVCDELQEYFTADANAITLALFLSNANRVESITKRVCDRYSKDQVFRAECAGARRFQYLCAFIRQWIAQDLRHHMHECYTKLPACFRVGLPIQRTRAS